jgi:flagellar basal body rod protein FlgG
MNYGLYLSATGVITSSYRQDVIANNLANSETAGFKRDLAMFSQRPPASAEHPLWAGESNAMLDHIGGGTFAAPTTVDTSQGTLESTGNDFDAAIVGTGYFTVQGRDGQPRLTRNGGFRRDNTGRLTLSTDQNNPVLDVQGRPIVLDPAQPTRIDSAGRVLQSNQPVAQLGIVDVAAGTRLTKDGGTLLAYPDKNAVTSSSSTVQGGFLERSNVDSATELTNLMDAQRQLEANANMIRYQDETLGELVNTVGKVS